MDTYEGWTGQDAYESWKGRQEAVFIDFELPEWRELFEDQQRKWNEAVAAIPVSSGE